LWVARLWGCGLWGCGVVGLWEPTMHLRRARCNSVGFAETGRASCSRRTHTHTHTSRASKREREREREREEKREERHAKGEKWMAWGCNLPNEVSGLATASKAKSFALRARLFASRLPASALAVQMSSSKHVTTTCRPQHAQDNAREMHSAVGCGVVGLWVVGSWVVGLLGCWVVGCGLWGCGSWVVGLWGCGVVGLWGCIKPHS
jgi:hypothetical protein